MMPPIPQITTGSPAEIAATYDSTIVVHRWGGTLVDFAVFTISIVSIFLLPERMQPTAFIIFALLLIAYYPLLEHFYGATLGKLVCRIRVVDAAGHRPSVKQAVIRTLLRLIEVNPVVLGGIPAGIAVLASKSKQRVGDVAAGTFVLFAKDLDRINIPSPSGVPIA